MAQDELIPIQTDPAAFVFAPTDIPEWATDPLHYREYGYHDESRVAGKEMVQFYDSGFRIKDSLSLQTVASIYESVEAASMDLASIHVGEADTTAVELPATLADEVVGVRRSFAGGDSVVVSMRWRNAVVTMILGVPSGADAPNQTIIDLATALANHVQAAVADAPAFAWDDLLPDQPRPWQLLLTASDLGPGWNEAAFTRGEGALLSGKAEKALLSGFRQLTTAGGANVSSSVAVFATAAEAA